MHSASFFAKRICILEGWMAESRRGSSRNVFTLNSSTRCFAEWCVLLCLVHGSFSKAYPECSWWKFISGNKVDAGVARRFTSRSGKLDPIQRKCLDTAGDTPLAQSIIVNGKETLISMLACKTMVKAAGHCGEQRRCVSSVNGGQVC